MPLVTRVVFEPSPFEVEQRARGMISEDWAAEVYGLRYTELRALGSQFVYGSTKMRGQNFYVEADIDLHQRGGFPSDVHRADEEYLRMQSGLPAQKPPETAKEAAAARPGGVDRLVEYIARHGR